MQYNITIKSAIQSVTTTILNFSGRFFVATLFDKINSALLLRLSKTCFIALNMYLGKNILCRWPNVTSKTRPKELALKMKQLQLWYQLFVEILVEINPRVEKSS